MGARAGELSRSFECVELRGFPGAADESQIQERRWRKQISAHSEREWHSVGTVVCGIAGEFPAGGWERDCAGGASKLFENGAVNGVITRWVQLEDTLTLTPALS